MLGKVSNPPAGFDELTIFQVFEVALNEFANVIGLRAPRASR
jgi:hypothetical protein